MVSLLPELLRTIFTLVREEQGLRVLKNLSLVCKAWRDVAQPVLWSHVVLDNRTLHAFIDQGHKSGRLEAVRSVTLHIKFITLPFPHDSQAFALYRLHGFPQTRILQEDISHFSTSVLPKLTSLSSFSLFLDDVQTAQRRQLRVGFRLQTEVLGTLLKNLPASCTSLELDTGGTDWSPGRESHHLCSDIWNVLPRLHHLKLRVHNLCSRILLYNPIDPDDRRNEPNLKESQSSKAKHLVQANQLSTFSICINARVHASCSYSSCPDLQSALDSGLEQPWLTGGTDFWYTKPLLLSSNLVAAYKSGCFPAATKIEVVQEKRSFRPEMEGSQEELSSMTEQEAQRARLYGHSILIRDCLEDKTYPMPIRLIIAGVSGVSGVSGVYDKSDNCVIGSYGDIYRHAENTVWSETVYGARMPFGVKMARAGATPRPPPELLTRKEWRQRSKKGMLSWRKEEGRTGVKIRRVIPLDGVDVNFDYSLMPLLPARGERVPGDNRPI